MTYNPFTRLILAIDLEIDGSCELVGLDLITCVHLRSHGRDGTLPLRRAPFLKEPLMFIKFNPPSTWGEYESGENFWICPRSSM
jgi:hypothetical protein